MSRIGNYETALRVLKFKAVKELWNDFKEFDIMKNHLSKEQIDKLKDIKDKQKQKPYQERMKTIKK